MKKRASDKIWIPFWVDKWLWGSMRIECTIEERAIWMDLLAIAAKDDGWIRANENTPYPPEQLAGMLMVPQEKLESAIDKFINLKDKNNKGKLTRTKEGILYVTKWEKYQFSDRWKREIEKDSSSKTEQHSSKTEPISKHNIPNNNKTKNNKEKIHYDFESSSWQNIKEKDMELWAEAYPACDIKLELLAMADWLESNPEKKKSNYRAFISRWLRKQQDQGGSKKREKKYVSFQEEKEKQLEKEYGKS